MKPTKPFNCPTLLAVVQKPFLTDSGEFCKLAPLIYLDGEYPRTEEFRNDGEVWWMLTPRTRGFAEPGRVVVAQLERAVRFDEQDEDKSSVQAVIDSIRDPGEGRCFPSYSPGPQRSLLSAGFRRVISHGVNLAAFGACIRPLAIELLRTLPCDRGRGIRSWRWSVQIGSPRRGEEQGV